MAESNRHAHEAPRQLPLVVVLPLGSIELDAGAPGERPGPVPGQPLDANGVAEEDEVHRVEEWAAIQDEGENNHADEDGDAEGRVNRCPAAEHEHHQDHAAEEREQRDHPQVAKHPDAVRAVLDAHEPVRRWTIRRRLRCRLAHTSISSAATLSALAMISRYRCDASFPSKWSNVSSALSGLSISTLSSVRFRRSRVVSFKSLASISPSPLNRVTSYFAFARSFETISSR